MRPVPAGNRADQSNGKGLGKDGQGILIDEMPWEQFWKKPGSEPCGEEHAKHRNGWCRSPGAGAQGCAG